MHDLIGDASAITASVVMMFSCKMPDQDCYAFAAWRAISSVGNDVTSTPQSRGKADLNLLQQCEFDVVF